MQGEPTSYRVGDPGIRELFSEVFNFEGNRAIVFDVNESIPTEELSLCIAAALTYHLEKDVLR